MYIHNIYTYIMYIHNIYIYIYIYIYAQNILPGRSAPRSGGGPDPRTTKNNSY